MNFQFSPTQNSSADAMLVRLPAGIVGKSELLQTLAHTMKFPAYFGCNWDALDEVLTDLSWVRKHRVIISHIELPSLSDSDLRTYIEILADSIEFWSSDETLTLEVTFPESERNTVYQLLTTR